MSSTTNPPESTSNLPPTSKVLVACEYSGAVREAFRKLGYDAWSCDLLPAEDDIMNHATKEQGWGMMIAFPPCTDLCVSGARWFKEKQADGRQQKSIDFFLSLARSNISKIAIENPVGIMSTVWRKPDQIIQPWMFGHGETKATCLWLKGLFVLTPTNIVDGRSDRIHKMPPSPDRWKERSRTYAGIATAMAEQWSPYL